MVTEMRREGVAEQAGLLGQPRTWVDARNGAMARFDIESAKLPAMSGHNGILRSLEWRPLELKPAEEIGYAVGKGCLGSGDRGDHPRGCSETPSETNPGGRPIDQPSLSTTAWGCR